MTTTRYIDREKEILIIRNKETFPLYTSNTFKDFYFFSSFFCHISWILEFWVSTDCKVTWIKVLKIEKKKKGRKGRREERERIGRQDRRFNLSMIYKDRV